ncbi:MAG: putative signal transducing protein [Candidatus Krumholzibacteriia bacterium]
MRHCPECGHTFPSQQDVCPQCWEHLSPGKPRRRPRLRLVYSTTALYEAEMIENLLQNEGIPCLKIPGPGAILWPSSASPLALTRLYVHAELASAARELIAEVTGEATDA